MSRGDKRRWIIAGSLVALTGLTTIELLHHGRRPGGGGDDELAGGARFRGLASGPLGPAGPAAPAVETPEEIARDVAAALSQWRTAIVLKDARAVIALDGQFRQAPDRFAGALGKSAETDDNERVRAFSTRVLGKLGRADLAPLFERLLADKSPYVRQNAAWALGQLAIGPEGRAAAEPALTELRHIRARDPASDVRLAAKDALDRLE